ncbi:MAG: type II toxin-antitoxin system VapC family toxin [Campylobacterales bacterium]
MNILIDTHIFLWLATDISKIDKKHFDYIADETNNIFISSLSIAEIIIKKSIGNLEFDGDILSTLDDMGIAVLDFDGKSAITLGLLPFHHKDPFDRMIISQAISKNYKLISLDRKFIKYDCELL